MGADGWQNGIAEAVERLRELLGPTPPRFDARDRQALAFVLDLVTPKPDPYVMRTFPLSVFSLSPAGRLQLVCDLLRGAPLRDENGEPTGDYSEPLITQADANRILGGYEPNERPSRWPRRPT